MPQKVHTEQKCEHFLVFLTGVLQAVVLDVCYEINWKSSVCIVSGCGYYDLGFIPGRNRNFFVLQFVHTCCCPVDVETVCMG